MPSQLNNETLRPPALPIDLLKREQDHLASEVPIHFQRPQEKNFLASERATTTILFGGLTEAHEELVVGAMRGLGYLVDRLPQPDFQDLTVGREFCNRGQCNPTYYTVGNLVHYLQKLKQHLSVEEIEKNYVFLTAGSCGPCRFGMYESEYRKAVIDAGFENFRIILFQQDGGVGQLDGDSQDGPGLDLNKDFVLGLLKSILIGDLINGTVNKIRPYEVESGATLLAKSRVISLLADTLQNKKSVLKSLRTAKAIFAAVECDYTQPKPMVKITGEFWASLTETQGNYFFKDWLVEEGAEVLMEPLTTWVEHLLYSREIVAQNHRGIVQEAAGIGENANPYTKELKLFALRRTLNTFYNLYRGAMGWKVSNTVNNRVLANLAHDYYNKHQGGGEAYMEVGSLVYMGKKKKAHLMVSVKPFGCLPSTASDGVQSKVMSDYPDILFLPLETSGDSEVNFKSRAQMVLFEAKQKAQEEMDRVIRENHIDLDEIKRFVKSNPQYRSGMYAFKNTQTGTGASFVLDMHKRIHTVSGKIRCRLDRLFACA
ncbi:MAG TPA: 2-hydroxyglutaryl-CoA dehydratase [Gammaproteobacteria bacterium]|nr:2-hydroxyglutaryl-CoA dehydratase [Gammaproteobacteria bacterium]